MEEEERTPNGGGRGGEKGEEEGEITPNAGGGN